MIQKYIILLDKYLKNQLSYKEQLNFEYTIAHNIRLSEQLKVYSTLPEKTFIKMYTAIKEKVKYQIQEAS